MKRNIILKSIQANLLSLKSINSEIFKTYSVNVKSLTKEDYLFFLFSSDIAYRTHDIRILIKKLSEERLDYYSSVYTLVKSTIESYIYMKYILSDKSKIEFRFDAMMYFSLKDNELKLLGNLKKRQTENKFIFLQDCNHILSEEGMNKKISEWEADLRDIGSRHSHDIKFFDLEVKRLSNICDVAKEYDTALGIDSIQEGDEFKSMVWVYHFLYRFSCMPAHQSIRSKEQVFELFSEKKKSANNLEVLELLEKISSDILKMR